MHLEPDGLSQWLEPEWLRIHRNDDKLRERVGGSEAPPGRQFLRGLSFSRCALLISLNFCAFSAGPSRNGSHAAQLGMSRYIRLFFRA